MAFVPNSSVAGFLASISVIPNDQALENAMNPTIAGILGLNPDTEVRPRFQPKPPARPARDVNWVAFGITRVVRDALAATRQPNNAYAEVIRNQEIEVLFSWYGPRAGDMPEEFADGLQIGQNRASLEAYELAVIEIGEARKAPDLFKDQYLTRYDQTARFRRRTVRVYPILTLLGFGIDLHTDPVGATPIPITYTP